MSTIEKLCDDYMLRFTRKQKTRFLHFLSETAKSTGWTSSVESCGFTRNVIIGNPAEAKLFFTAHYDTPMKTLFPYTLYPKSKRKSALSRYLPVFILLFIFVLLSYLLTFPLFRIILFALYAFLLIFLCFRLWFGPANYENWNANTSGVAVLLMLMQTLNSTNRKKVAFIFLDNGTGNASGSRKYVKQSQTELTDKLVIDLDCVGKGDAFYILPANRNVNPSLFPELVSSLKKEAVLHDKLCTYVSDCKHPERGSHSYFPCAVGIRAVMTSGKHRDGIAYIGTSRDDSWEESNLKLLVKGLRRFVEQY